MKKIEVTIKAGIKTGKTTIAALLLRCLNEHGIDVDVEDLDMDQVEKLAQDSVRLGRNLRSITQDVHIKVAQVAHDRS